MKQKVKMLKTTLGCDDGVVLPATYHEGREYEIGDSLLTAFVDLGVVELTEIKPRKLAEGEMLEAAPVPAGVIETKITQPEETKPAAPAAKKGKK